MKCTQLQYPPEPPHFVHFWRTSEFREFTSNGPHLEAVLAWILPPGCEKHPSLMFCIPQTLLEQAGMVGADRVGLNCCSDFRLFTDQSTQHMVVSLPAQVGLSSNEVKLPGLFLQDPLQLIRIFVLLSEFPLCFNLYLF